MENILFRREGGHLRAYPLSAHIRITSHLGAGRLVYATDDGWLGVHLDSEPNLRRIDEVAVEHCRPLTGGNALREIAARLAGTSAAVAA